MDTLEEHRKSLAGALQGVGAVLDHMPERLPTPAVFIAGGSPYIESGDTFGSYAIRFTLVVVASKGTNEVETSTLDRLITKVLVSLDAAGWDLERVDQPLMLASNNTHYLSTTIDVKRVVSTISDGGT